VSGIFFETALTPAGWRRNVRVAITDGVIASVEPDRAPAPGDEHHGIAVPGMPNLHSHAFQRGMAGLAERRGTHRDSFWTWRETMYRFALTVTPEDVEAIAAMLYAEMLEAGFTRVGEFHYLHHAPDGRPYDNVAELAERIAAAADETGIGLTLIPTFYAHATFGGAPPLPEQRRFICDIELFARLLEAGRNVVARIPSASVGVAPHSLRAAGPDEINAVVEMAGRDAPIHIHVAEQVKEIEDCLGWSGQRPVEWLLDHFPVDRRWCLIHATHMTDAETEALAASRATAGLCPITEANLGDGIFNGPLFVAHGGRYGIGSDSDIRIGVADELRQFEYAQRLKHRARNVMAVEGGSTGRALFETALSGGNTALGIGASGIGVGVPADIVTLDTEHPALAGRKEDHILDAWIFSGGNALVDCVYVRGEKRVENGRHTARQRIAPRFQAAMRRLTSPS